MRLDFSTPFSRFFQLIGGNFALFVGLGLVGVVLPSLAISYGLYYQTGFGISEWTANSASISPQDWAWLAGGSIIIWILKLINLSMVTEFAILRAVGKPADIASALGNAGRNIVPLVLVSILVGLMVTGGLILLIVPGIIWALASCVAVPAYVSERGVGMTGAISRSFELTRNNRWTLFAIFLIAIIVLGVVLSLIGFVSEAALSGIALGDGLLPAMQAFNTVAEAFIDILSNVFVAAIYVCLREVPGKQTASQAASVFE